MKRNKRSNNDKSYKIVIIIAKVERNRY